MKISFEEFYWIIAVFIALFLSEYFFSKFQYQILFTAGAAFFLLLNIFIHNCEYDEYRDFLYPLYQIAATFVIFCIAIGLININTNVFNGYFNGVLKRGSVMASILASSIYILFYAIKEKEFLDEKKILLAAYFKQQEIEAEERKIKQAKEDKKETERKAKEPKPMTRKEKSLQDVLDKLDKF